MQELDFINRKLGGHAITIRGIEQLIAVKQINHPLHIVEIGCGGGDNLRAIKEWAEKKNKRVQLSGIDINQECIAFARKQQRNNDIRFIHSDYRNVDFPDKPDIVFSSLFCHHFTDEELIGMLQWLQVNSAMGFFMNDLHRHPLAYHSIRMLTKIFSKSYLVKNDAPLSVRRGFKKEDWDYLFSLAGISHFKCHWQWAFRWLVTCETNG